MLWLETLQQIYNGGGKIPTMYFINACTDSWVKVTYLLNAQTNSCFSEIMLEYHDLENGMQMDAALIYWKLNDDWSLYVTAQLIWHYLEIHRKSLISHSEVGHKWLRKCQVCAKPIPTPMLTYCQLDTFPTFFAAKWWSFCCGLVLILLYPLYIWQSPGSICRWQPVQIK